MGWLDEGIDPVWVRAAAAVADVLVQEPVDWLVSSPLARALHTAAPLAARLGLDVDEQRQCSKRSRLCRPRSNVT